LTAWFRYRGEFSGRWTIHPASGHHQAMGESSGTTQRTTSQRTTSRWAALDIGIVVLALVLVWLFRFKSTVCAISSFTPCPGADARQIPTLVATGVLVFLLCGALVTAYLVPSAQRSTVMSGVSLLLAIAGLVASLVVLFSAGFVLWPVWV
jgi:hypothetical protein